MSTKLNLHKCLMWEKSHKLSNCSRKKKILTKIKVVILHHNKFHVEIKQNKVWLHLLSAWKAWTVTCLYTHLKHAQNLQPFVNHLFNIHTIIKTSVLFISNRTSASHIFKIQHNQTKNWKYNSENQVQKSLQFYM